MVGRGRGEDLEHDGGEGEDGEAGDGDGAIESVPPWGRHGLHRHASWGHYLVPSIHVCDLEGDYTGGPKGCVWMG